MSHRSFIRKSIANVFYRFVFESEKHNGIAELLEILGSIVNGFALPLKPEHVIFLERALIPLHRPRSIASYYEQLSYCINQYVQKDKNTVQIVVNGLIKAWPISSSSKQMIFLNELEDVLELAGPEAAMPVMPQLFRCLGKCVGSAHFQVAERSLFLWNNDTLLNTGILSKAFAAQALPYLFSGLKRNSSGHWNATVETLASNVLKHYQEADPALYDRCAAGAAAEPQEKAASLASRKARWQQCETAAAANSALISAITVSSNATAAANAAAAAAAAAKAGVAAGGASAAGGAGGVGAGGASAAAVAAAVGGFIAAPTFRTGPIAGPPQGSAPPPGAFVANGRIGVTTASAAGGAGMGRPGGLTGGSF